jgi:branched-chain amino acid transport system substrate-binding protein
MPTPAEPIRIGFMADLSGPAAAAGKESLRGVLIEVDAVNASGGIGGRKIELLTQDVVQSTPEAVKTYTRFAQEDRVTAVIGSLPSRICLAVSPVASLGMVVFVTHCSDDRVVLPELSPEDPSVPGTVRSYTFITQPTAVQQGTALASFLIDALGKKRPATLCARGDPVANLEAAAFEYYVKERGFPRVVSIQFMKGDTDFRDRLSQIIAAGADSLLISGNESESILAAGQAKARGIDTVILGNAAWDDPLPPEVLGLQGVFVGQNVSLQNPGLSSFMQKYNRLYRDESPSPEAVSGADDLSLILQAVRKAGSADPKEVRDALEKMARAQGTARTIQIDARTHRLANPSIVIFDIDQGVKTASEAFSARELR